MCKKKYSFILLFLTCFITLIQCNNNEKYNNELVNYPLTQLNKTLLLPDDTEHPINIRNWDWTIDKNPNGTYKHFTAYVYHNNSKVPLDLILPYSSGNGPAFWDIGICNLLDGEVVDVQPEDGWFLFSKDFGCDDREEHLLPQFPYFILYNRPRGILRLFYYYPDWGEEITFTYAKVVLSHHFRKTSHLSFESEINQCLIDYPDRTNLTDSAITMITKLRKGQWNYADFVVAGYDPYISNTALTNANFIISIYGMIQVIGEINSMGIVTLVEQLEEGNIATPGLSTLINAGQEGWSYFKRADGIFSKFGPYGTIGSVIVGAAGFIYSAISSNGNNEVKPMKFEGNIFMNSDVNLSSDHPIGDIQVSIPATIRPANDGVMYDSIYQNPLGVFILNEKPVLGWKVVNDYCNKNYHDLCIDYRYEVAIGLTKPLQLIFNPTLFTEINGIKYRIKSVQAKYVWGDHLGKMSLDQKTTFQDINQFYNNSNFFNSSVNLNQIVTDASFSSFQEDFTNATFLWRWLQRGDAPTIKIAILVTLETNPSNGKDIIILKTYNIDFDDSPCNPVPCVPNSCIDCCE